MTVRDRSGERGFTVVEVLIAVLVLMVVASSIGLATIGGAKVRGAARLQASMTEAGKQAQEDIATDRSWMTGCQAINRECRIDAAIQNDSLELDDVDGRATLVMAGATPLDSRVDGLMPNDSDGLVPDYYRLRIVIRPAQELANRYSTTPQRSERTIVTTIDRRGEQAVGSLAIEICRVRNQTDERMSIQGCAPTGMTPIREGDCAPLATVCRATFSWVAARAPSATEPSPFVVLDRVNARSLNIRLRSGTGWSATMADAKVGSDGRLLFDNVPAGEVMIDGLPPGLDGGTERWRSKELPAFLGAVAAPGNPVMVEPGVRSRALAIYRPKLVRGVNLQFERRTRTFYLTGPKSGRNLVVAPWARTHDYQGVSAERMCDSLGAGGGDFRFNTMWCEGQRPGPGRNCVTVLVGMDTYYADPNGMYFIDEGMLGDITPGQEDMYPPEIRRSKRTYNGVPAAITCTWYWEEYFTTYYSYGNTTERVRQGIAQAATYSMTPMPDYRYVDTNGPAVRSVVPQCRAQARQQCSGPSGAYPYTLRTLVPGLNTGLTVSNDGRGMSAARADSINTRYGASPAGAWSALRSPATWVRTNGTLVGSNGGSVPAGSTIRIRGEGECYWRSPFFAGEAEGECNPCRPLWKPGMTAPGCSLLTRVQWKRHAKETVQYLPLPIGGPVYTKDVPSELKEGVINFNPPYVCSAPVPQVIGGCRPWGGGGGGGGGGGANVPATKHRAPTSGGSGGVRSHAITAPAVA